MIEMDSGGIVRVSNGNICYSINWQDSIKLTIYLNEHSGSVFLETTIHKIVNISAGAGLNKCELSRLFIIIPNP